MTYHFARACDDEDVLMDNTWEHEYERNLTVVVGTVTRFATYSIERLLLVNFPSHSRKWCFTSATERATKLQYVQSQAVRFATVLALLCRWPVGLFVPIHLWESAVSVGALLMVVELSLLGLLGLMVGFIRIAHYTAQITGWEHPDHLMRAFAGGDCLDEHCQFVSPFSAENLMRENRETNMGNLKPRQAVLINGNAQVNDRTYNFTSNCDHPIIMINGKDAKQNGRSSETELTNRVLSKPLIGTSAGIDVKEINIDNTSMSLLNTAESSVMESSFMGFSPVALGNSTWLKTRNFTNSIFSNSTQSTSSCDTFGGPSIGTKYGEIASSQSEPVEIPDLLTGTPRRHFT